MQWYLKSDPTTSNGSLVLTANRQTVSGITPSGQPTTYNYASGEVDTHGKFSFQYGYVEWRAQVPAGQGLWPALWLLPADGSWPPEIDALEVLGNDPATAYFTNYPPSGNSCAHALHGADLSAAPHVFGVNWQPTGITWYVDGAAVARCTTADGGISAKPMYLVMNLAVGGSWPGAPSASTPFPARMTIDWVRVWQ
jgi:beta-glucanase (GH16 family)